MQRIFRKLLGKLVQVGKLVNIEQMVNNTFIVSDDISPAHSQRAVLKSFACGSPEIGELDPAVSQSWNPKI